MSPKVLLSLTQPSEMLPAGRTAVDFFSSVNPFMSLDMTFLIKRLTTVPAVIWSLSRVSPKVDFEYMCITVAFSTELTVIWPLFLMHHHVCLQESIIFKWLATNFTVKQFVCSMALQVRRSMSKRTVRLLASRVCLGIRFIFYYNQLIFTSTVRHGVWVIRGHELTVPASRAVFSLIVCWQAVIFFPPTVENVNRRRLLTVMRCIGRRMWRWTFYGLIRLWILLCGTKFQLDLYNRGARVQQSMVGVLRGNAISVARLWICRERRFG